MSFSVIWREAAEGRLADLWTTAADKDVVVRAADTIDDFLARDAATVGESRGNSTRILIVDPLAVYYDVEEEERVATVWAVWRIR